MKAWQLAAVGAGAALAVYLVSRASAGPPQKGAVEIHAIYTSAPYEEVAAGTIQGLLISGTSFDTGQVIGHFDATPAVFGLDPGPYVVRLMYMYGIVGRQQIVDVSVNVVSLTTVQATGHFAR